MLVMPPKERARREREEHENRQNKIISGLLNEHDTETLVSDNTTITDCIEAPIKDFKIRGKNIKQEIREGYNLVDEKKLVAFMNIDNIINDIITSTILNSDGIINIQVSYPAIAEGEGDYYISCDIRLKSGSCERLNSMMAIYSGTADVSSEILLGPNISSVFQTYKRKMTFTNLNNFKLTRIVVQPINCENAVFEIKNIQISKVNKPYEKYGQSPSIDYPSLLEYVVGEQMLNHSNVNLANTNNISSKLIYGIQVTNNNDGSISLKGTSTEDLSTSGIDLIERIDINDKNEGFFTVQVFGVPENSENGTINVYYFGVLKNEEVRSTNVNAGKVIRIVLRCNLGAKIDCTIRPFVTKGKYTKENIPAYIKRQSEIFELTNLPEMYSKNDYIYYDEEQKKYFVHNEYDKLILDGTKNKFTSKSSSPVNNQYYFSIDNIKLVQNDAHIGDIYCNYLKKTSASLIYNTNIQGIAIRSVAGITLGFSVESGLDSVDKTNEWLKIHNLEIVYPLAKPKETDITDVVLIKQLDKLRKMMTHKGTNHFIVTSENGQSANLKVIAYKDTFKILKEEIDNLKALLLES